MAQLGKLYLIPTTLGETENPFDVEQSTVSTRLGVDKRWWSVWRSIMVGNFI